MENVVKSCYIEPEKIIENKSEMEEDIDLVVKYFPKSDITEDEFQPKEKFVVGKETPQKILETEEKEEEKSVKLNSI